ncbi:MAG: choice-of-anchor tandem repeat NxxGxxAF-containing protein [Planctomycetota bacterium]
MINAHGLVAGPGWLTDESGFPPFANDFGATLLLRAGGEPPVVALPPGGVPAPDGNGTLRINSISINDTDQLLVSAGIEGSAGGADDNQGIYALDLATSELTKIAREGDAPPEGDGVFKEDGPFRGAFEAFGDLPFTNGGFTAFLGRLDGDPQTQPPLGVGIYRGSIDGTLTTVARRGRPLPGLPGLALFPLNQSFTPPQVGDNGLVAFHGSVRTPFGVLDDFYLLVGNGTETRVILAPETPFGDGSTFAKLSQNNLLEDSYSLSPSGDFLAAPAESRSGGRAIMLADTSAGGGLPTAVVRLFDPLPDDRPGNSDRQFITFEPAVVNDSGRVAFRAITRELNVGFFDGVFAAEADGTVTTLASPGDSAPANSSRPDASFLRFAPLPVSIVAETDGIVVAQNALGQVVFGGVLDGPGSVFDNYGLYFSDPDLGLFEIALPGQSLLGSTLVEWTFDFGGGGAGSQLIPGQAGNTGLGDGGQVAYRFELADGRSGIAVWSIPEPGMTALLLVGSLSLRRRVS